MRQLLSSLLSITILVFAVASMLSVGCNYTLRQILAPLRSVTAVARALTANFVLVPLLVSGILRLIPLAKPLAIGLMLMALGAGAPFLVKLILAVEGDVGLSATLLVLLLPVTIFYMPVVVPALFTDVTVSGKSIAAPLILSMLLPLAVGLFVKASRPQLADGSLPITGMISAVALVVLLALTLLLHFQEIVRLSGTSATLAAALMVAGGFVIGYAVGSNPERRIVLGFGTAQRNLVAAMVVATESFDDPDTLVMVVLSTIVSLLLLFPAAWVLRQRHGHAKDSGPVRHAA